MEKPKIGLALGSGGARGLAHIGVLKVLQQENIPIDYIAGSSIGSLLGVLFANGISLEMLEQLALHLRRKYWMDFTFPRLGFLKGNKIREVIRLLTKGKQLEELPIPVAIIATDLGRGERVVFQRGSIDLAVRASISIPGIFLPVFHEGRALVDGGVIDRVPVSVVRKMGSDLIIAVDVHSRATNTEIKSIFDVMIQTLSIMEREIILSQQSLLANVIIRPDVGEFSGTSFAQVKECIERGEEAARIQVGRIKEMMGNWKGGNGG